MTRQWIWRAMASAVLVSLAACGGGGGGGGGAAPCAGDGSPTTLSGVATFDSIPNNSGALVYTAITAKPVRGAAVEIVDGSAAVLVATSTDGAGAYSATVPSCKPISVRVKAQMSQGGAGPSWDVTVRDNTQSNAIYAMESGIFSPGSGAAVRNVHAPSGWTGNSYGSPRIAAPFAVLDTIYTAQAKVLSVAPATVFPPLRVFWSVNNLPASGNPAIGQIGTTFFTDGSSGRAIYVLGMENVDTDEYDASVIAHEWGHYYQAAFSRDDSPGGSHSLGDRLDRRLAFSEGWGNAWSGIALARSNYADSVGAGQAQGSNINLATGAGANAGWYREASIQSIFWNLNNQLGFKPIHDALTGPFKSGLAVTSIHPFAAAFATAAPAGAPVLAALLTGQSINPSMSDAFGTLESNAGGVSNALPMYVSAAVGGATTQACISTQAGTTNKLGNFVYLKFAAPTAGNFTINVSGPAGTDPDFVVYNGGKLATADGLGINESAVVGLPAGESVLVLNDFNNSAGSPCFNVTIQ